MNILHATTDPPLLQRLKEMLGSSARADIAVGYFPKNSDSGLVLAAWGHGTADPELVSVIASRSEAISGPSQRQGIASSLGSFQ